ncbi:MAG: hypothetical protein AB7F50_11610 [Fimbriimonadaceae bacterium]
MLSGKPSPPRFIIAIGALCLSSSLSAQSPAAVRAVVVSGTPLDQDQLNSVVAVTLDEVKKNAERLGWLVWEDAGRAAVIDPKILQIERRESYLAAYGAIREILHTPKEFGSLPAGLQGMVRLEMESVGLRSKKSRGRSVK